MSDIEIDVNGACLVLDASGAAWWPGRSTLIFADLDFEKGSFYAMRGAPLPPYDTRTTLKRMADVIRRRSPKRVIALGDSFHDGEGAHRLDDEERAMLGALQAKADWIWITGNHDPAPPPWLGGHIASHFGLDGLLFRHEPHAMHARGEVAGHLHPCTTVNSHGRSLRRRCFVSDGTRLVLPAFGAYAGGLDIWHEAIGTLFEGDFGAYILGARRVYAVAGRGRPKKPRLSPHGAGGG